MSLSTKTTNFVSKQIVDIKTYGMSELFWKFNLLIKLLAIIPIYILVIVPCVIIRLMRPWIVIRIERINAGNFGSLARHTAIYYCEKKLKINQLTKKHIDLFYLHPADKTYNKQLIKMWKRKLNFISGHFLNPVDKVNKLIPGWKIHTIGIVSNEIYEKDANNLIEKYQPLDFTSEEESHGKEMLKKFGLNDGDKFVCLAVRDASYQLKKISSRFKDWSYHEHRNFDIDDFVMAAESLAAKGYYVFRMGVVAEKSLNTNNTRIIDYVNSNLRSDFMDVYLGAKCSFCLSTGFGFEDLPYIFRRPIALIQCPFGDISRNHAYSEKFLVMTKHHFLKKENRRLSLSEIFSYGVAFATNAKIFEEKEIELINNTPEEIKDLVVEMAENLESNRKFNPEDEELQETFKSLFASNIEHVDLPWRDLQKTYRQIQRQIKIRFSTEFLRKNKHWLR